MKIIDSLQDLSDGLGGILLGKLALLADTIEKLAASSQLGHDVILVLARNVVSRANVNGGANDIGSYPRLEPVNKLDNVRMMEALEHVKLIVYHPLIALDILLQDDLDSNLASWAVSLAYNAVRACT